MNRRLVVREAEDWRRSWVAGTKRCAGAGKTGYWLTPEEEEGADVSRRQHIEDLNDIAVPEQPALSPDGQEIVYVLRTNDAAADRNITALWRVGSRTGDPQRLTTGEADSSPAWSPDGSSVAFLRAGDGPAQVWLLPAKGGEPRSLTELSLGAGHPSGAPTALRSPSPRPSICWQRQGRAKMTELTALTLHSSPSALTTRPTA